MTTPSRLGALLLALALVFAVSASIFNWRMTSPMTAATGVRCPSGLLSADQQLVAEAKPIRFSQLEQFTICATSFGVKPIYELLALGIVIALWKKREHHWRFVRWGLLAFFLGENACAVNYMFYGLTSFTWEFWHCFGMLLAVALISCAAIEFADTHMVRYGVPDRPCSFLDLCRHCYKHQPVSCTVWTLMLFFIPAAMVLCFLPLTASFREFSRIGNIFGAEVLFSHARLQQLYEIRIYPILALILFALSWLSLLAGRERGMPAARLLFAAGLGPFGFSLMRFVLFWGFSENILWAEVWEEFTELLTVLAILVLLNARRIGGWLQPAHAASPVPEAP